MVMLEIVQKHEIIIEYQEVEIINLFRSVLEQLNLLNGENNTHIPDNLINNIKEVDEEDDQSSESVTESQVA
jgi:hypothetical protein